MTNHLLVSLGNVVVWFLSALRCSSRQDTNNRSGNILCKFKSVSGRSDAACRWGTHVGSVRPVHITQYTLHITHYKITHYKLHSTHNILQTTQPTIHITHLTLHNTHYTLHISLCTTHITRYTVQISHYKWQITNYHNK